MFVVVQEQLMRNVTGAKISQISETRGTFMSEARDELKVSCA